MNGYSVEGIPYKYEGPLRQISYSQVFYDALNEGYLTPVSYMMRLIHECNQYFDNEGLITGIVGFAWEVGRSVDRCGMLS